ncbi:MAG: hypothetical protein IT452_18230 [Planctomycetia bacterium]|nr:hypothetical protein [Planctomycetia bacterium]
MKRLLVALAVLMPGCTGPEPARAPLLVRMAWTAPEGTAWTLRVAAHRKTEVEMGRGPTVTEFEVKLTGEFRIGAAAADGSRAAALTVETLDGWIDALGLKVPFSELPGDFAGRTVKASIDPRGRISWDEEALRGLLGGVDLNEDLERLFPVLPEGPKALHDTWASEVDQHLDTAEISEIAGDVVHFRGTSKADEEGGGQALESSLKVSGGFAGEWDAGAGALRSFREEISEDARVTTARSKMRTGMERKREVTLERR